MGGSVSSQVIMTLCLPPLKSCLVGGGYLSVGGSVSSQVIMVLCLPPLNPVWWGGGGGTCRWVGR